MYESVLLHIVFTNS